MCEESAVKHKLLALFPICFLLLASCQFVPSSSTSSAVTLPASITFVEQVSAKPGELVIPYKKYKLANGLTLILHQDHTDPLVHVDVTYHVGSAREQLNKSGFAHFFEHMMFQGSKHVADEQHFKVVSESGGSLNGTTNTDRTNYYETVPKNQLEKVLWLESDRMGYLLEAITEPKFEVQRATVINERGQNVDNRPYGRLEETVNQVLYPREHPYSWPVIGYKSDLNQETLADLKQFFLRYYGPNNAVLTIGGDLDEQQTLNWVAKYFSELKPGPTVKPLAKSLVSLANDRYFAMEDNVSLPLLYLSFPTVYAMHEDEPALDVLANILGNGATSLLYQKLVKTGLAVQAGASHPCKELACKMNFFLLPNPQKGLSLKPMEKALRDVLVEFEQRGVNDDDLLKTKVSIETGTIYGLQSVSGKVSSLAFYQTFTNNANFTAQEVNRYQKVTKADVMRVFRKYIKGKGAAIISVIPKGQQQLVAHENNFTLPDVLKKAPVQALPEITRVNPESFDRNIMPKAEANPAVKVPTLWREKFANGLTVLGTTNSETPTVSLLLTLDGGTLLDTKEKAGLAVLTAAMMEQGTKNYEKEALSNELAKLGSDISVNAAGRSFSIRVDSLTHNLDATLNLLLDVLYNPAFTQQDFDRLKNQQLQSLKQAQKNPNALAGQALKQVLFGENERVGLPDAGTIATVSAITLTDVKNYYQQFVSPKHASLVVVGDIEKSAFLSKIDYLTQWQGADYLVPVYRAKATTAEQANIINFVDVPEAKQSVIMLTRTAMPYDAFGDYFKASLMNYPLGGAFNSRINLNLREDKGYTYGASSGFTAGKTLGYFTVKAGVKIQNTVDAMREIEKEIQQFAANGLTLDEVNFMKSAITQNDALSYETPRQKSRFLQHLYQFSLPTNYGEKQTEIIRNIDKSTLNAIAKKELSKPMQWIVVGNAQVLNEQFKALKLKVKPLVLHP
jgi:zinc protease